MKTSTATTNNQGSTNLINRTMKKITNVSPFLLLLVPVFFMMIVSFSFNQNVNQEEAALKTTTSKTADVISKATKALIK